MKAKLIHYTPLTVASDAIRTCWSSFDKSDSEDGSLGQKDKELIYRVGNQYKHASTLEHINYTFYLTISRAVLQEMARHRIASLSVKSSRYTIKELKNEEHFSEERWSIVSSMADDTGKFFSITNLLADAPLELPLERSFIGHYYREAQKTFKRASKYVIFVEDMEVNRLILKSLNNLIEALRTGVSNDIAKYALPECYKTELTWTVNARSLQNFLALRTNKAALWEIRQLAYDVFEVLPEDHKYLFEEFLYKEKGVSDE